MGGAITTEGCCTMVVGRSLTVVAWVFTVRVEEEVAVEPAAMPVLLALPGPPDATLPPARLLDLPARTVVVPPKSGVE